MSIGTSKGMYYDDEFHQAVENWKKSTIQQAVENAYKGAGPNEEDMLRTPLEIGGEFSDPKGEMTPDWMQKQKQVAEWDKENPDVIFNDQGQVVDYAIKGIPDLSNKPISNTFEGRFNSVYETPLTEDEELKFQYWKKDNAPYDSGEDYDFRGAFKAGVTADPRNDHWPDTYKKPNHPTFSDQSIYAKDRPDLAGSWDGEFYVPPPKR